MLSIIIIIFISILWGKEDYTGEYFSSFSMKLVGPPPAGFGRQPQSDLHYSTV
jgi:hypothetical protein